MLTMLLIVVNNVDCALCGRPKIFSFFQLKIFLPWYKIQEAETSDCWHVELREWGEKWLPELLLLAPPRAWSRSWSRTSSQSDRLVCRCGTWSIWNKSIFMKIIFRSSSHSYRERHSWDFCRCFQVLIEGVVFTHFVTKLAATLF